MNARRTYLDQRSFRDDICEVLTLRVNAFGVRGFAIVSIGGFAETVMDVRGTLDVARRPAGVCRDGVSQLCRRVTKVISVSHQTSP